MHELSITQGIIDIVLQHAERGGAKRVNSIHLVIGDLTGLVDDSIQFYFDMLSSNTIAAGAKLVIQRVLARLRCRKCACEFEPPEMQWICPECSAVGGEPVAGREFLVESIEVE